MSVLRLHHEERVRLDPTPLAELYLKLGEVAAENALCEAMEELALLLARVDKQGQAGALSEAAENARGLAELAERIGMPVLARVSRDVAQAAERIDPAALGATLSRLSRVGDKSLSAIWDPQDMMV